MTAAGALPTPTVAAASSPQPAAVTAVAAVGVPAVRAGQTVTVATVDGRAAIGVPSALFGPLPKLGGQVTVLELHGGGGHVRRYVYGQARPGLTLAGVAAVRARAGGAAAPHSHPHTTVRVT